MGRPADPRRPTSQGRDNRRAVAAQRRWLTAFGVLILFAKMPPEPQARFGHGQRSGSRCPTLAPRARTPEQCPGAPAFWTDTQVLGDGTSPVRNSVRDLCSHRDRQCEKRAADGRH